MKISSPAFQHNQQIPSKYTCEGQDASPPLTFTEVPENTKSLALICEDPDAPDPKAPKMVWDHWVVFNIPPDSKGIEEQEIAPGIIAKNSWRRNDYGGPCPPIGNHRYFFKLYALDCELELSENAEKKDVEQAMRGHIIEQTEIIGLYEKKK